MPPLPAPIDLPSSYPKLPYGHIKVTHYPESSPEPTPIIIVTLNRPKNYNAFTNQMANELEEVFGLLSIDDRVKVVVMTGAGKMFCAGMDLQEGFKLDGSGARHIIETEKTHRDEGGRVSLSIHQCQKPVIGALNGSAVGVGISMCMPMSIRVVSKTAKVGFVFGRRGLVTEAASSFFLPRLIGHSRALHLVTTGAAYPADHKLLEGLFSEVCDSPEATLKRALEIADEVVQNVSITSAFLSRELMYRGPDSAEGAHLLDSRIMYGLRTSTDNDEGVKSFLEKRKPKFTGTMAKDAPPVWPWYHLAETRVRAEASTNPKPKL